MRRRHPPSRARRPSRPSRAAPGSDRRRRPARSRSGRRTARAARERPLPSSDGQPRQQLVRSSQVAGDRVADAHGDRRRRDLAFFHHVEVVIEGGHFVDLGHRHLQLSRERDEMRGRQTAEAILNPVQVLDQQVAPARSVAEQRTHLVSRRGSTRAFGSRGRALSACAAHCAETLRAFERERLDLRTRHGSRVLRHSALDAINRPGASPVAIAARRMGSMPCYHRLRLSPAGYTMHVEFLGIPRERAGISELEIEADTLGQLLGTLAARCPALGRAHHGRAACIRRSRPT